MTSQDCTSCSYPPNEAGALLLHVAHGIDRAQSLPLKESREIRGPTGMFSLVRALFHARREEEGLERWSEVACQLQRFMTMLRMAHFHNLNHTADGVIVKKEEEDGKLWEHLRVFRGMQEEYSGGPK